MTKENLMMVLAMWAGITVFGGDEAKEIFVRFERNLSRHRTVSGDLVGKGPGGVTYESKFLLQKPSSFRFIDGQINIYCDGRVQFNHLVSEREYIKSKISTGLGTGFPAGLDAFFGFPTGVSAPYFAKKTEFRMQKVDGDMCAAKAIHFEGFGRNDRMVFYVDRTTKQILGWDQVFGNTKMPFRFKNLRVDVDVPGNAFDWRPSTGLKERTLSHGPGKY